MKASLKAGTTSHVAILFIQDSTSTTGAGKTGLAYNTAGLSAYYARPGAAAAAIVLATQTVAGAFSSGGFVEIDAANMPGFYRLDVPDAVLAAGAKSASILLKGATGMAPLPLEFELTAWDNQDSVRGGLTALPNAAAEAAGGLFTRGAGAGQINQAANGNIDVNAVKLAGAVQTGRDIGASVLLSSGTGAGQLDFTAGVVKANLTQILGTALTETAGQIAAAFRKFFNVAVPTGTVNSIPDALPGAAGGVFVAGANAATTVNITGNVTGSLSGSVGSVTADVGITQAGADKVWNSPARTLTSFGTLAADVWASAVRTLTAFAFTPTPSNAADTTAIKAKTDNLPLSPAATGDIPTAIQNADALLDRADAIETGWTVRKALRIVSAVLAGKASGGNTTVMRFRNLLDTKDRVTATVDPDGNRTAVTTDAT